MVDTEEDGLKKRWKDNLREGLERYDLREIEAEDKEQWKKHSIEEILDEENLN